MPIRPENKHRYAPDWKSRIVPAILARAGNRCEGCGLERHALGGRHKGQWLPALTADGISPEIGTMALCSGGTTSAVLKVFKIRLTVAHLNHTILIHKECR